MKRTGRVPVLRPQEAVELIRDEDVVAIAGAGGGELEATEVILALADRYRRTGTPKNLTFWHSLGLGDRADRGMSPLAQKGLVKRVIGGHWGQSPRLADMADRDEIEAYNFPAGVMCQLARAAAAGYPGIISHVGKETFLDPKNQGGKLNQVTKEDLILPITVDGRDYLYYKAVPPNVAVIRGTTADTEGYVTLEDEISFLDCAALAMAAHNSGGIVICQVQKMVAAGSLHPKQVRIPGCLVDAVVVVPDQPQLYDLPPNRFLSGDYRQDLCGEAEAMELNERKVIARRAILELEPGDIGNLGVGIADGVSVISGEEGISEEFTLTVEGGTFGGVSLRGIYFGATANAKAILDMPSQFDFYDGGGLDICFLSFAEVDQDGNVNVHKFNGKTMGTGGFVDICQNAKKVVFLGTLTAGGLKVGVSEGQIKVRQEGRFVKFVRQVPEITFHAGEAVRQGKTVLYVTERGVFRMTEKGLELTEIAPGADLERDILAHMEFRPKVAEPLRVMEPMLFREEIMGIRESKFGKGKEG